MKKEIRKILKRIACIALLSVLAVAELKAQQDKVVSNYSNESEISAPGSVTLKAGFYIPSGNTVRIYTTGISYIKCIPSISSPSIKQNYVSTRIFKMAGVNSVNLDSARSTCEVNQAIQYFDGLGRPLQVVGVQESPQGQDLVQPFAYDAFGKESIRYLPYAAASNGGAYRLDALQANLGQQAFYNSPPAGISNISSPFSKTVIEASPLNRVTEQGAPGSPWQPLPGSTAGHTAKIDYGTNIKDEVKLWKINASDNGATATVYEPGSLSKITSKDENWKIEDGKGGTVEEFQDSRGRVVLKRVWENDNKNLSTCYVYDDLGNLRYVLPSAVNENGQNLINSFDESQTVFSQFIYGYHYDGRKRLVEKKIPGKGWEYIVYNKLNQVVASQDAIQRAKVNQDWTINKYDFLGRIILTGVYTYPSSSAGTNYRSILQSTIDAQPITVSLWENRVSTGNGYTNQCWPTTGITTTLTVNYYDDYAIPGLPAASPYNLASSYSNKVNLLPTASLVNVLGTSQMLWKVNYYDDRGRPVRGIQQHYKGAATTTNNYDDVISTYSFSNELLTSTRRHYVNGVEQLYVASRFTYDAQGRAIDIYQKTGDNISTPNAEILLSRKNYNEIGQLTSKQLYSANTSTPAFAQTVTYSYNARGWLKSQSAPLFTQILKYEDAVTGVTPQYNGNISRQEFGVGKYFNYAYDKLSRLNSAVSEDNNNELMGYDVMGNITRLQRKQTGALVDQLKYTYTPGNQLSSVLDSNTVNTSAVFQVPGTTAYTYDQNGNLFSRINTVNPANNLSGITYNYLNLPNSVTAGSTAISYTYDATGNKLRKQVPSANINNEYISGIQYEGGVLKYVGTSEGRVVRNSATNYSYEYSLTDHLNNGRVYFDINAGAARAIQVTDYYAFGLDIQRTLTGTENKYQYNGKEKQDQEKLYDYGFRFYDPVVGRLSTIDPLAENHFDTNPYHYVLNNPMRYMDYLGLDTTYNQNNMTGKDWHNYKSGSDDINLNNVTIVGQRPGSNWGGFSGGFGNSGSWGNGFGGGAFGFGGFGSVAIPPPVLTSSSSGPFKQLDNRGGEEDSYTSKALAASAVLLTDDLTGIGAVDDVAIPVILAAAAVRDLTQIKFVTYTLTDDKGKIYVGRTSGYGDPYSIMMNRYSGHHMRKFGYGNPQLDRWVQGALGYPAIRGREQQLIDHYGGIGKVGNSIRGVGYYNPAGKGLHNMSDLTFGPLAPYTGYFK